MADQRSSVDVVTQIYTDTIAKAVTRQLSLQDLVVIAEKMKEFRQRPMAVELYKTWIAYNSDDKFVHIAYFNYGISLAELPDTAAAVNALRECIRLKPDFYSPYINLGRVLEDAGQLQSALGQWTSLIDRLASVNGDSVMHKVMALQQLGRVLKSNSSYEAAEEALKKSLDLNPAQREVIHNWIALRQGQCKWPVLAGWDRLSRTELADALHPLSLLSLSDDPMFQLAKAHHYNREAIGVAKGALRPYLHDPATRGSSGRLRIGYISSDFRDHAVGFAMTDVIETHDRAHFEIFAYYCGIKRPDDTQARIQRGADHWIDITSMSDEQAATRIFDDGIDIVVDLNGYTNHARTKVFAYKPAPVVVNWFGYPSTMGSPYHHYLIADAEIIPDHLEMYCSEKVVRLPCYQPNDRRRTVAETRPTRADENLPAEGFVFCCLNGPQKLTALTFKRWVAILQGVPDSVLWLLTGGSETDQRLRRRAAENGIAPERLIFAERCPNPLHLARYPLADLFLDNLPYGAHTTAADAMWMGVPILTLPGRSFPSRVCASLVKAAGVGELVCATPDDYVARAIEYGLDCEKFLAVKQKLVAARDSCPLFDTARLVARLEDLYRGMWRDFEGGTLPVPDLDNLDAYHAIGLDLDLEGMELLDDEAYEALYRDKLSVWTLTYPIKPDNRLWRTGAPPSRKRRKA